MSLKVGSSAASITPASTQFLDGYPLVRRFSTGVDTDLFSAAIYVTNGSAQWLAISLDLLFVDKEMALTIRRGIAAETGLPADNILVAATHSHSAPVARGPFPFYTNEPERHPDPVYMQHVTQAAIESGVNAVRNATAAEIGLAFADSSEVGGNRRIANGIADPVVPVLAARQLETGKLLAILFIVSIHPTVLHEDSTLVSGDFPGHARQFLQQKHNGIPIVTLTGAAGNQSPRYFARSNTVAEASRLGQLLGDSVISAIETMSFVADAKMAVSKDEIAELPFNEFPSVAEAKEREANYLARFQKMRDDGNDAHATRTAETDWFGATRLRQLAELKASGELEQGSRLSCLPAEIQLFQLGDWMLLAWPGEVFVEYALELKKQFPNCQVITYANGHTQGYLVTAAAAKEGGYEASAATFKSPDSPRELLDASLQLIRDSAMPD